MTATEYDGQQRTALAAALLFTTRPTDRALAGWDGDMSAVDDLAEMAHRAGRAG